VGQSWIAQYNPPMSGRTFGRLAAVVVVAAVAVVAVRWWNNPERRIEALLAEVAAVLTYDAPGTDLGSLAAAAGLQPLLAPAVVVDVNPPSPPLRGRQEVVATAARIRASRSMMRIQFFDAEIAVVAAAAATVRVTVQVTTRDASGADVAEARGLVLGVVEEGGRWTIAEAHLMPETTR